jgi:tetratricopeptide (TPR) repeat protein
MTSALLGTRPRCLLFAALFLVVVGGRAFTQMDWMPQLLRDLPPELQEGIPEDMTFDEYQKLNRNIDFFTVGMSMLVPGYGLFSVDRPVAGASIVAARAVGYGLITVGLVRQRADLLDLVNWENLNALQYERARNNFLLVAGGSGINIFGWGLDVLWAFHVAKNDKDFVIYKYGLKQALPGTAESKSLHYIEALREQPEKRLSVDYERALSRHLKRYPYGDSQARVDFLEAEYRIRTGDHVGAALHLARALALNPDRVVSPQAQELLSAVVADNEQRWEIEWQETLERVANLARNNHEVAAPSRRHLALIRLLAEAPHAAFREAGLIEVRRMLTTDTPAVRDPEVLITLGGLYESLGRPQNARQVYTVIREFYPESPELPAAAEALARLAATTPASSSAERAGAE